MLKVRSLWIWPVLTLWLAGVAGGLGVLAAYAQRPGRVGEADPRWPEGSRLPHEVGRPTMLVFLHPRCPCSAATVGELHRALASGTGGATLIGVIGRPGDAEPGWMQSGLVDRFRTLTGARIAEDLDGAEASIFGAETSGTVMYFDAQGRLRFAGGVTPARGHEGDNIGRDAIARLLRGELPGAQRAPVYGCGLVRCGPREVPE